MAGSVADYANQMVQSLAISEPELDTAIGSPTRKIIDAVAEVGAAIDSDKHLLDYIFDIDAKSGDDLDDFVLMFGFTRFAAKRATGVITFSRPSAADQDYPIPAGTQVSTATAPEVVFLTVAPATLLKGETSIDVPIQAVVGGESGNLAAATLTRMAQALYGFSAATTNFAPTTGGTNEETDAALRDRYKKTIFRSMAGTEDMFLGVALEDTTPDNPDDEVATQALVIGASKRWREQVQIAGDGTAVSTIPAANVKFVYPGGQFFGEDIEAGSILTPGVHYTFDNGSIPPVVTSVAGALEVGGLYDLDFEYAPTASRNDPFNGITNRVDLWVNGMHAVEATETLYFRDALFFSGVSTDILYSDKFVRQDTNNVKATANNYFVPLAFGPISIFPSTLTINGITYVKGVDYWVVHDDTAFGYGPTSLYGLEWLSTHKPSDGQVIALSGGSTYIYNRLPRDVEDRARQWRLVTTDVRAHQAKRIYLRLGIAVMFVPSFDRAQVTQGIETAVTAYFTERGLGSAVQVSDLLQVVHNEDGVDNVRFLTSAEAVGGAYAIQRVSSSGALISTYQSGGRATDVILSDNEVPVLHDVVAVAKAQNSFGVL